MAESLGLSDAGHPHLDMRRQTVQPEIGAEFVILQLQYKARLSKEHRLQTFSTCSKHSQEGDLFEAPTLPALLQKHFTAL